MLRCYASKCFIQFWINQQYFGTTMLNNVGNLVCNKPKIDWRQHATISTYTEKTCQQSSAVMAHNRNTCALRKAKSVQPSSLRTCKRGHLCIRLCAPRLCWLIRLVDERDSMPIHLFCPAQMVNNSQWNFHLQPPKRLLLTKQDYPTYSWPTEST